MSGGATAATVSLLGRGQLLIEVWRDMQVDMETVVAATREHVSAQLEDEAVVLGLAKGMYYGMGEVAARIWGLLQEPRLLGEVRDVVVAEFEVSPEQAAADIVAFVDELIAEGLAEVQDEPAQ